MHEFSELEAELKQLQPRATSPDLTTRVDAALATAVHSTPTAGVVPKRRQFAVNWFTIGLGVAAAAAFVLLARVSVDRSPRRPQTIATSNFPTPAAGATSESANGFVPDGLTRVVYHTRDEGLVFPVASGEPVRRVRSRARETLHWTQPGTGASLHVSYPTDDLDLIPISGQ